MKCFICKKEKKDTVEVNQKIKGELKVRNVCSNCVDNSPGIKTK